MVLARSRLPSLAEYRALAELRGSDLHIKVGSPPRVRIDGRLRRLQGPNLSAADTAGIADEVVGVAIDELNVTRVAGSSLTSGGFNAALEDIKDQAAS